MEYQIAMDVADRLDIRVIQTLDDGATICGFVAGQQ
ncbi:hypothetical protein HDG34_003143 [Paraburkholderia sp. HC6.4b]|nr:hypothetical protein [Paraburkholderia sp. HC6.4b]MBB5450930.1 hypothetical protein [Paraburkholderia sp. Kb1A]